MASIVDICNLALARLGDNATVSSIDPPEGSAQAEHCQRFYPVALASLLEMHAWRFATTRQTLAPLDITDARWAFVYAAPSGMIRALGIMLSGRPQPFEMRAIGGAQVILTDQEAAALDYVEAVTDSTRFSPLFVDALAWLLASYLAGPVLKGDAGAAMAKACMQSFMLVVSLARASDAGQQEIAPEHTPGWIGAR